MYSRKNKSWDLSLTGNWNSVSDDGVTQNRTWDTNQLLTKKTSQVNQNYTYDKRGNQITRNNQSLQWDIDGHLQSISQEHSLQESQVKVRFAYDALSLFGFGVAQIQGSITGSISEIEIGGYDLLDLPENESASFSLELDDFFEEDELMTEVGKTVLATTMFEF